MLYPLLVDVLCSGFPAPDLERDGPEALAGLSEPDDLPALELGQLASGGFRWHGGAVRAAAGAAECGVVRCSVSKSVSRSVSCAAAG